MTPYLLTLLHFNIQYCAGGLEGLSPDSTIDVSDSALQDRILDESLAPVLDVLDAHPSWTFDLEMQGYLVEVMAERRPEILDHLRTLANSGQVELVSFHYSDQLWVAFPAEDMAISTELTRRVFEDNDLPLSEVVFTQEGQFSQGMLDRMPAWGWSIAVLPSNLGGALWGGIDAPLYRSGDALVVSGAGIAGQVGWTFLNDGELWATSGRNCYLGGAFVYSASATAERVAELEALEASGSRLVGIGTYAAEAETGDEPALPTVLDGTWQPDDTDNLGLWMGGSGLWGDTETDNGVRVANTQARRALLAAGSVPGADEAALAAGWKALLLGEVSDATGWNPYTTEVQYGLDHSAEALAWTEEAIAAPCAEAGARGVRVVGAGEAGAAVTWDPAADAVDSDAGEAPPTYRVPTASGRDATLRWTRDADGWRLDVDFAAGEGTPALGFGWDGLAYSTVPALGDALVDVDASAIAADGLGLPLSWGIAGLGEGWYVVKHAETVHLAGLFSRADGTITFRDETAPAEAFTWSFELIGPDTGDALAFARGHNVYPTVDLACPEAVETDKEADAGCGCASAETHSRWAWLGLACLALRRSRRPGPGAAPEGPAPRSIRSR